MDNPGTDKDGGDMAITKIWPVKDNLSRVYRYISNENKTTEDISDGLTEVLTYTTQGYKTNEKEYITGINCSPATAVKQMIHTKKSYGKDDGVLAFHAVQSFKPGELTPEQCHEIGVRLANLMWGDRFEVVVSTHLDKQHLHNHFVVNSVSFMDGKKFDNNRNDYNRFRNLSDDLCNGYNLSVIHSNGKGMHHSEWEAVKEGKPYFRQLIKHDVDVVLSYARNMDQFVEGLQDMGYEVSTSRKYIAVKHPQGQRMRRLKSLLRDGRYDEEHIEERLYNNLILPMVKVQDAVPSHFYRGESRKLKGFRALYFKYMYMLGIIHAKDAPKRYPSAELRRDLIYMDKITEENTFLGKNNLETIEDVTAFKSKLDAEIHDLINDRKKIYGKLKRVKNEELKVQYESDRDDITSKIAHLKKQLRLCHDIENRVPDIEEKLKQINELEEQKNEKQQEYERSLNI